MVARLIRCLLIICFSVACLSSEAQENPLERKISLQFNNVTTEDALREAARKGNFLLSYDATAVNADKRVSGNYQNQSVSRVVKGILGEGYKVQSGGSHIIILPENKSREKIERSREYAIKGEILEAGSGRRIAHASVHEVGVRNTVLSTNDGTFQLPIKGGDEFTRVLVSRKNYRDTVLIVRPQAVQALRVQLRPLGEVPMIAPLPVTIPVQMQEHGLFRGTIPGEQIYLTENLPLFERSAFQLSFLPALGTNGRYGGLVENNASFNVIGGYSMALSGFEIAGLFNVTRKRVRGAQIAGFMNFTGGKTTGFQLAGFNNNNLAPVEGAQLAGFYNVSTDSLYGVQMAGFYNMARQRVYGGQIAGFMNLSGHYLTGVQASGFLNVSGRSVKGVQASGFSNIAWGHIYGAQTSGFLNLVKGTSAGAQVTGGINVSTDTAKAAQVAGMVNFARRLHGVQVAGILNVAGRVKGAQIGLINVCDSLNGFSFGLLSFVGRGYHKLEFSGSGFGQAMVALRTGPFPLYNIVSAGVFNLEDAMNPDEDFLSSFGYGLGSEFINKRWFFAGADAIASIVFPGELFPGMRPDLWGRASVYLGVRPLKWLQIFAGPTFNSYRIDNSNLSSARPELPDVTIASFKDSYGSYYGFISWTAGIRIF